MSDNASSSTKLEIQTRRADLEHRRAELERPRGGANAGGVDPTTFVLLDRLNGIERKLDGGEVGGRVTPPPMPPAADPATQVAKIVGVVKDLGLLPGAAKQEDVVGKIVEHLPAFKSVLEVAQLLCEHFLLAHGRGRRSMPSRAG